MRYRDIEGASPKKELFSTEIRLRDDYSDITRKPKRLFLSDYLQHTKMDHYKRLLKNKIKSLNQEKDNKVHMLNFRNNSVMQNVSLENLYIQRDEDRKLIPNIAKSKELEVPAKFGHKKHDHQDRYRRRMAHNRSMEINQKRDNGKQFQSSSIDIGHDVYSNITIEPKARHYAKFAKKIKELSAQKETRNYKTVSN